jgi:hypothetical protein
MNMLLAAIWRRGRGVISWRFRYVEESTAPWFSTPGWYRTARKHTYRLTIDHDFPGKLLWLGKRENGTWVNTEGLYEPLCVLDENTLLSSTSYARSTRKSVRRKQLSKRLIQETSHAVADSILR